MGSVPVQLLVVCGIATHTTCDTMGIILKAMTFKDKASRQQKTTHICTSKQATRAHASKVDRLKSLHQ